MQQRYALQGTMPAEPELQPQPWICSGPCRASTRSTGRSAVCVRHGPRRRCSNDTSSSSTPSPTDTCSNFSINLAYTAKCGWMGTADYAVVGRMDSSRTCDVSANPPKWMARERRRTIPYTYTSGPGISRIDYILGKSGIAESAAMDRVRATA